MMISSPSHPGFEEVFTTTEYFDGPRQGVANYGGAPHFYDCIFSEVKQDFTCLYRLTPVVEQIFQLALEDWSIWRRWELSFQTGKTTVDTHPALPEDAVRHREIELLLADRLKTDPSIAIVRSGKFISQRRTQIRGVLADFLVKWSNPSEALDDRIWLDSPHDCEGNPKC